MGRPSQRQSAARQPFHRRMTLRSATRKKAKNLFRRRVGFQLQSKLCSQRFSMLGLLNVGLPLRSRVHQICLPLQNGITSRNILLIKASHLHLRFCGLQPSRALSQMPSEIPEQTLRRVSCLKLNFNGFGTEFAFLNVNKQVPLE